MMKRLGKGIIVLSLSVVPLLLAAGCGAQQQAAPSSGGSPSTTVGAAPQYGGVL